MNAPPLPWLAPGNVTNPYLQPKVVAKPEESTEASNDFSFADLLDIINPLQHIPLVSTLYRSITGDTIKPESRILGGALLAGPVGLVVGVINSIAEEVTGKDVGEHLIALFEDDAPVPVQVAQAVVTKDEGPLPWLAPKEA